MVAIWQEAVILFVVEDVTFNIGDQKAHELEVKRQCPEVRVVRKTIAEIARKGFLNPDKSLVVDNMEVAVIYWRCGQCLHPLPILIHVLYIFLRIHLICVYIIRIHR